MWKSAFRFMVYDRPKFAGIIFGIIISVFLIGAQLGILGGLLETSIGIAKGNEAYIYVVNPKSTAASFLVNMDVRVGNELRSIPGVEKVYPVIVTMGSIKSPNGQTGSVTIVGVQAPGYVGGASKYSPGTQLSNLQNEGAVIVDNGDLKNLDNAKVGDHFTINDQKVYISGLSLDNGGLGQQNIITTIERARKLASFNANEVSAFLVKTTSADPLVQKQIVKRITKTIPKVKAATGIDFKRDSIEYMKKASGIMISFMILVGFALVTGLIIVGLTMYSSVNDRIRDYGTIKAIGGGNGFIIKMIMTQSVIYALLGFSCARLLLYGIQYIMHAANKSMQFSTEVILFLISSTLIISVISSYFSLRKIVKLEPVQIFRM